MSKTTPPPSVDVASRFPELAEKQTVTMRLHPRQGKVNARGGSKMGGTFLWPDSDPWPTCSDSHSKPHTLVPILQLTRTDFPEMEFPEAANLFQLLWCPSNEHDDYLPKPSVYWRASESITSPLLEIPTSAVADDEAYIPRECRLFPERVVEYPHFRTLPAEIRAKLIDTKLEGLYQTDLSVCPSNKVGGYVYWVQDPELVVCACGRPMTHLLTLGDSETVVSESGEPGGRWLPIEDRWVCDTIRTEGWQVYDKEANNAAGFLFGHSLIYLFVCRACEGWPIKAILQR